MRGEWFVKQKVGMFHVAQHPLQQGFCLARWAKGNRLLKKQAYPMRGYRNTSEN